MRKSHRRRKRIIFYIGLEGDNEKLYFDRLQELLNEVDSDYCIVFNTKVVGRPPVKCVKWASSQSGLATSERYALFDYEDEEHLEENKLAIDESKENNTVDCLIVNLTFEVWILLHKLDFRTCVDFRHQYLIHLNRAYNKSYSSLAEFKNEVEFKRILGTINLSDVSNAYFRSKVLNANTEKERKIDHRKVVILENPDTNLTSLIEILLKIQKVI